LELIFVRLSCRKLPPVEYKEFYMLRPGDGLVSPNVRTSLFLERKCLTFVDYGISVYSGAQRQPYSGKVSQCIEYDYYEPVNVNVVKFVSRKPSKTLSFMTNFKGCINVRNHKLTTISFLFS